MSNTSGSPIGTPTQLHSRTEPNLTSSIVGMSVSNNSTINTNATANPNASNSQHTYSDLDNLSKTLSNYINNSSFADVIFIIGMRKEKVSDLSFHH